MLIRFRKKNGRLLKTELQKDITGSTLNNLQTPPEKSHVCPHSTQGTPNRTGGFGKIGLLTAWRQAPLKHVPVRLCNGTQSSNSTRWQEMTLQLKGSPPFRIFGKVGIMFQRGGPEEENGGVKKGVLLLNTAVSARRNPLVKSARARAKKCMTTDQSPLYSKKGRLGLQVYT